MGNYRHTHTLGQQQYETISVFALAYHPLGSSYLPTLWRFIVLIRIGQSLLPV